MEKLVHDFVVTDIHGQAFDLAKFRGQVLLVVNTASGCGFAPQLAGLQALHERFGPQGLVVMGFPCNQFGGQEPGDNTQITEFCDLKFGVSFPLMAKVSVNGPDALPLYQWLTQAAPGLLGSKSVKWNFTKFLVERDGRTAHRFAPQSTPASLSGAIEKALAN